jgi:uncharacterized membrane protein
MSENKEKISQIRYKLDLLLKKHEGFTEEINELLAVLDDLLLSKVEAQVIKKVEVKIEEPEEIYDLPESDEVVPEQEINIKINEEIKTPIELNDSKIEEIVAIAPITNVPDQILQTEQKVEKKIETTRVSDYVSNSVRIEREEKEEKEKEKEKEKRKSLSEKQSVNVKPKEKSNIERFIGENLIALIGIVILLIGVGVGVKYSIEHNLVSPLTRIVSGYLMGLGLLGFGMYLKKNYLNFSAILVSGSIAILYFVTYFAYAFYQLMPQGVAFGLMVIFTSFAAIAAINYNKQVIAHIGLVGAYAVPFLLSKGTGQIEILFSYMAIINIGILILAFKKYWKPLYYVAFSLTWLVFFSWFAERYQVGSHFGIGLIFLSIFFVTFYIIFLSYKLIRNEKFEMGDVLLLIGNAIVFYGLGYAILQTHEIGKEFLGLFTLVNAIIHFCVALIFYRQKSADKNIFYLVIGMVLVFLTITVPIQFDGHWVTLLWATEAAALFWIGRTKNVPLYEKISYALMLLAFISILQDWQTVYSGYNPSYPETRIAFILNINFLTSLLFIGSFAYINILYNNKKYVISPSLLEFQPMLEMFLPTVLFIVLYFSMILEISTYWNQLHADSLQAVVLEGQEFKTNNYNIDFNNFKAVWFINYSLFFFSIISFINIKKIKSTIVSQIFVVLNIFALIIFLTLGIYYLGELRDTYLQFPQSKYYIRSNQNILIRYISYGFVAFTLVSIYKVMKQDYLKAYLPRLKIAYDFMLTGTLLLLSSSELVAIMDMLRSEQSYKLVMSILWSIFALLLIAYGIWKKKKHLRIVAMGLFTVVIVKLFVYDLAHLNTISKTIVLIALGLILLVSSFLYNKYKYLMVEDNEKQS